MSTLTGSKGRSLGRNRSRNILVGIGPIERPIVSIATFSCTVPASGLVVERLWRDSVVTLTYEEGGRMMESEIAVENAVDFLRVQVPRREREVTCDMW